MYECCTSTSVTYQYECSYRWGQQPYTPLCILHMLTVIHRLEFLRIAAATERKANKKKPLINIMDWNRMTYTSHFLLSGRSSPNGRKYAINWVRYVILKTFQSHDIDFKRDAFAHSTSVLAFSFPSSLISCCYKILSEALFSSR